MNLTVVLVPLGLTWAASILYLAYEVVVAPIRDDE